MRPVKALHGATAPRHGPAADDDLVTQFEGHLGRQVDVVIDGQTHARFDCAADASRRPFSNAFRDLSAADAAITNGANPNVIWLLPDLSPNPLDPKDPTQMLLVRMMGAVAQFERDRLAERRTYGIVKAKAEGKYKGRAPTARAKTAAILKRAESDLSADDIAKLEGVSRASVYRILKEARPAT